MNQYPPPPTAAQTVHAYAPPQTQPVYQAPAAPPPPAPYPPQGYASQHPQGFAQGQPVMAPSLGSVSVSDLNLMPQININGKAKYRVLSYVKGMRQSGPAYTLQLHCVTSDIPEVPVGSNVSVLFKISFDPKKQGGDKGRKRFVLAVGGANVNPDEVDAALQARDFTAQPLFVETQQRVNYGRPVVDNNTRQVIPNQWWSDLSWSLSAA